MKKAIGSILVTLLGLALLIYSAARSLDFISMTLPPDKQVLAWFGLAALDGGLLFWMLNYLYGAAGGWQRGIALLMVIVDFIGAVAMFTLDTLYNTGQAGMTSTMSQQDIKTSILALSGIIALNVGATVAHHLTDPENRKRQAAEEAQDQIEELTIQKIAESSRRLAGEIAPHLAADWAENTKARYMSGLENKQLFDSGQKLQPALFTQPKKDNRVTVPLSNNGHGGNV